MNFLPKNLSFEDAIPQVDIDLTALSYDELKTLQTRVAQNVVPGGAQMLARIQAQLTVAMIGSKVISRAAVDQQLSVLGAVKDMVIQEGEVFAKYSIPSPKGMIVINSPIARVLGETAAPPQVRDFLKENRVDVMPSKSIFLQACRLISSYCHVSDGAWKSNLTQTIITFNKNLIPFKLDILRLQIIKITGNVSGVNLYNLLSSVKDTESQNKVIQASQAIEFNIDESNGVAYKLIPELQTKAQVASHSPLMARFFNIPNLDEVVAASKIVTTAMQKLGGTTFMEVNSDFTEGVRLKQPYIKYRELFRNLENFNAWELNHYRIGLETKDNEIMNGVVALFERWKAENPEEWGHVALDIIGPMPKQYQIKSSVAVRCMYERGADDYDYIIIPDPIPEPALKKAELSETNYYAAIMESLGRYDTRDHKIIINCPYVVADRVEQYHCYNPVTGYFLTVYQPLGCGEYDVGDYEPWPVSQISKFRKLGLHVMAGYPSCHEPLIAFFAHADYAELEEIWARPFEEPLFPPKIALLVDDHGALQVLHPTFGRMDYLDLPADEQEEFAPLVASLPKGRGPKKQAVAPPENRTMRGARANGPPPSQQPKSDEPENDTLSLDLFEDEV